MTSIEFHTESENAYLVDVVNLRIKHYLVKGNLKEKTKWKKYLKLEGTGKLGSPIMIHWTDKKVVTTAPVISLKFVK